MANNGMMTDDVREIVRLNTLCGNQLAEIDKLQAENERYKVVLEKLARLGNEPHLGNSDGNKIAQQALKEPTGARP